MGYFCSRTLFKEAAHLSVLGEVLIWLNIFLFAGESSDP